jgi:hypothetical protein
VRTECFRGRSGVSELWEWILGLSSDLGVRTNSSVSIPTHIGTFTLHSGRVKRRSWGLTIRSKRTLMVPERFHVETARNTTAVGTFL